MNIPALRHILIVQFTLALLASGIAWALVPGGVAAAGSAFYGGMVPPFVTLLSAWRTGRASAAGTVGGGLAQLYLGIAERYGLVVVLLGAGFTVLQLAPAPLVLAFAAGQLLGPVIGGITPHTPRNNDNK